MDFEFSVGWMVAGLVIAAIGGAIVFFYRQIAENLANGVVSYDRVRLFGIIMVIVGLMITANLHTLVLSLIVKLIAGK